MATTPQCSSTPSRSLLTRRQVAAMEPAWQPAQQALKPTLCPYSADIQPRSLRTKGARAQGGRLQQPHGYSRKHLVPGVCAKCSVRDSGLGSVNNKSSWACLQHDGDADARGGHVAIAECKKQRKGPRG